MIDVRIPRADLARTPLAALPGLVSVQMHPPASGPEVELTFEGTEAEARKSMEVLARGVPILAIRERGD